MGLYELVDYLVRLKLADHRKALCVLSMVVQDVSWSEIYEKCGVVRGEVKGYLGRVREKFGNGFKALIIVKHVLPLLNNIQPVVVNGRCTLCGYYVAVSQVATAHLLKKHKDVVDKYVSAVIEELSKTIS
jgi:hypothetical protein